jgi:hypothetical protein
MSAYGGFSNSSSKNQGMSQSGFNSSQQIDPQQAYQLQRLWAQINGMMQTDYANKLPWQATAAQQANDVYNTALPYWEKQMQGGAYSGLDADRIYENIYGSQDDFQNMQNKQRIGLSRSTTKRSNKLDKLTQKQINRLSKSKAY